jgi:NADH dehydrogenase
MAIHAVTGAFGFSGRRIARRLLEAGHEVLTLTNSPDRPSDLRGAVRVEPFDTRRPEALMRSLHGVSVLHNTYWVRFDHASFGFEEAVRNSAVLFDAARRAGVGRIVHVSITNPSERSRWPYFRGKARVEGELRQSGLPHSILRPAVLFGDGAILINNIAWALRRLPVFGLFGDGRYRLDPIHVDDLARLAVDEGEAVGNRVIDAVSPDSLRFTDLVGEVGRAIGRRRLRVPLPPAAGFAFGRLLGRLVGDVLVTRDEIEALMAGLLHVDSPPLGQKRLRDWLDESGPRLGRRYASELGRRLDRSLGY